MTKRYRLYVGFLFPLCIVLILGLMAVRIQSRVKWLIQHEHRLLLSTALAIDPKVDQHLAVDRLPQTAILNLNHLPLFTGDARFTRLSRAARSTAWSFRLDRPFFQVDAGLTHLPGNPPRINPLLAVRIWPGNQKNRAAWLAYARPRRIELVFFRQRLVDADRQYRIIGKPRFWQSFRVELSNTYGVQEIPLNFREKIGPSRAFPGNIDLIWCRLEILDYYKGNALATKTSIALSELDFVFQNPYRKNTLMIQREAPMLNKGLNERASTSWRSR